MSKSVKTAPAKSNEIAVEDLVTIVIEQFIRRIIVVSNNEIEPETSIILKNWYLSKSPEEKRAISDRVLGGVWPEKN